MKKRKMLGLLAMAMLMVFLMPQATVKAAPNADGSVDINEENFPDAIFREYVEKFDDDDDGVLSMEEQNAVLMIVVTGKEVASLDGVEYFPKLQELYCDKNELTSLDVSKNTSLEYLDCCNNELVSLDVGKNTALEQLRCTGNNLTSLDVSNNMALTSLSCYENDLTSLNVSKNTALDYLVCYNNDLTSLDVSKTTALDVLHCGGNSLMSLDVSNNAELTWLECYNNDLTSLDVSKNTALERLNCISTNLTSLDVSNNVALERLYCSGNNLTSLDVSNNTALEYLHCYSNQLISLNLLSNSISDWSGHSQKLSLGEVSADGFNIKDYDADIDVAKVTNVTGATYDAATGMFTGYAEGTPITYTYLSTDAAGTNHELVVSLKFTVKEAPVTVAIPVADVPAGTYNANQKVTLSTATEGATIYYTTDGSEPTTASTVYTGAIEVSGMEGSTVVTNIKAIAGKDGMSNSPVASFVYTIKIPHTHSYSETYKSDADGHWKECSCGAKSEEGGHTPGAAATETTAQVCTVCNYVIAPALGHQHSYSKTYEFDANGHWKECSCGAKSEEGGHTPGAAATETTAQVCTVCNYVIAPALGHQHSYSTTYSSDADGHWKECSCGAKSEEAGHTPGSVATETTAQVCTVCNYVIAPALGHQHSYSTTYSSDATNHWYECSCGDKKDVAAHSFDWVIDKEASIAAAGSKHEECSVCDYAKAAVEIPQLKEEVETDKPVVDNTPVVDEEDEDDDEDEDDEEEETVAPAYAVSPKTGEVSNVWAFLLAMFALATGILFCNAKKMNKQ